MSNIPIDISIDINQLCTQDVPDRVIDRLTYLANYGKEVIYKVDNQEISAKEATETLRKVEQSIIDILLSDKVGSGALSKCINVYFE